MNTLHLLLIKGCDWSEWNEWSQCSKTCGRGHRTSKREIIEEYLDYGWPEWDRLRDRNHCEGKDTRLQICNKDPCPGIVVYF